MSGTRGRIRGARRSHVTDALNAIGTKTKRICCIAKKKKRLAPSLTSLTDAFNDSMIVVVSDHGLHFGEHLETLEGQVASFAASSFDALTVRFCDCRLHVRSGRAQVAIATHIAAQLVARKIPTCWYRLLFACRAATAYVFFFNCRHHPTATALRANQRVLTTHFDLHATVKSCKRLPFSECSFVWLRS